MSRICEQYWSGVMLYCSAAAATSSSVLIVWLGVQQCRRWRRWMGGGVQELRGCQGGAEAVRDAVEAACLVGLDVQHALRVLHERVDRLYVSKPVSRPVGKLTH